MTRHLTTAALAAMLLCTAAAAPAAVAATREARPAARTSPAAHPQRRGAAKAPSRAARARAAAAAAARADASEKTRYGSRADVLAFAAEAAQRRGLDAGWLAAQLADAHRIDAVQRLMMPPPAGTAKDWDAYRSRFVEPRRITAGAAFWQVNAAALRRAEERFGVPAEIIVGIVGVETFYGRVTGGFRVVDALATLAFDFPAGRRDRSSYFRAELEEFFVLCQRERLDPQAVKGSFAGAIGLAQFMPGSINRHAVDFDGDGRIDIGTTDSTDATDAVGSIAHYLAEAGWQRGMPPRYDVAVPVDSADRAALLVPDIVPTFSAAQMAARGAVLLSDAARAHSGPLALVELQNGDRAPSFVAGTANFYALTRYNQSSYYAMAVITLGEAVAAQRAAGQATTAAR